MIAVHFSVGQEFSLPGKAEYQPKPRSNGWRSGCVDKTLSLSERVKSEHGPVGENHGSDAYKWTTTVYPRLIVQVSRCKKLRRLCDNRILGKYVTSCKSVIKNIITCHRKHRKLRRLLLFRDVSFCHTTISLRHTCRNRQSFGGAKEFCPDSPKLARKILQKSGLQKKALHVNSGAVIFKPKHVAHQFCSAFQGVLEGS